MKPILKHARALFPGHKIVIRQYKPCDRFSGESDTFQLAASLTMLRHFAHFTCSGYLLVFNLGPEGPTKL